MTPHAVELTRRRLIIGSFGGAVVWQAAGGFDAVAAETSPAAEPAGIPDVAECLDYGRSFVCHSGPFNAVRFWVESRTTIVDDQSGSVSHFYQCGSCKSERTFAEQDLFYENNYDFLPIIGSNRTLMFRRKI